MKQVVLVTTVAIIVQVLTNIIIKHSKDFKHSYQYNCSDSTGGEKAHEGTT